MQLFHSPDGLRRRFLRVAPRLGFAWQEPLAEDRGRGRFGIYYTNMNGLNYRNAVVSNETHITTIFDKSEAAEPGAGPDPAGANVCQVLFPVIPLSFRPGRTFPWSLRSSRPRVSCRAVCRSTRRVDENTTFSIGTMWTMGFTYDYQQRLRPEPVSIPGHRDGLAHLPPLPPLRRAAKSSITLPNMDNGLLTEQPDQPQPRPDPGTDEPRAEVAQIPSSCRSPAPHVPWPSAAILLHLGQEHAVLQRDATSTISSTSAIPTLLRC